MQQVIGFFCGKGKKEEKERLLSVPLAASTDNSAHHSSSQAKTIKVKFNQTEAETLKGAKLTLQELPLGLSTKTKILCSLLWGTSLFTAIYSLSTLIRDYGKMTDAIAQLDDQQLALGNTTCADGWENNSTPDNPCHYDPSRYPDEFRSVCDNLFAAACHLRNKLDWPAAGSVLGLFSTLILPPLAYNAHTTQYYELTTEDSAILAKAGYGPKQDELAAEYAHRLISLTKDRDFIDQIASAKETAFKYEA